MNTFLFVIIRVDLFYYYEQPFHKDCIKNVLANVVNSSRNITIPTNNIWLDRYTCNIPYIHEYIYVLIGKKQRSLCPDQKVILKLIHLSVFIVKGGVIIKKRQM